MIGREQVAQLRWMGGQTRKDIQFIIFWWAVCFFIHWIPQNLKNCW